MSKDTELFQKGPEINYHEEAPEVNLIEFKKVVDSRRSIRIFDEKAPIPEDIMNECFHMALLAPNSSNLQAWEFYWVKSPEKKEKLVEACFSQLAAKTAQELVVFVARTNTWKKNNDQILHYLKNKKHEAPSSVLHYYGKLIPFMMNQGPLGLWGIIKKILFFIQGFYKVTPRGPTSCFDMKIWAVKSTALACENFMLAMRAHGFDTCPMEGYDLNRVKKNS